MEDDPVIIPIEGSIDLHSFAPRDVVAVVDDYLVAAHEAGFREVRLIHGRGKGVQRAAVQRLLREHALVERYRDAPESHLGATLVVLKHIAP
jgi:DNA-nicking Smr family endonuclease